MNRSLLIIVSATALGKTQDEPALLKKALGTTGVVIAANPVNPVPKDAGTAGDPPANKPAPPAPAVGAGKDKLAGAIGGFTNLPDALKNLPGLAQLGSIGDVLKGLAGGDGLKKILDAFGGNFDISGILAKLGDLIPGLKDGLPGLDGILAVLKSLGDGTAAGGFDLKYITDLLGGKLDLAGLFDKLKDALAGQDGIAKIFSSLISSFGGAAGGLNLTDSGEPVPDLAALLQLDANGKGAAGLLQDFRATARLIHANYSGEQAQALLSLLKAAYAQAYAQLPAPAP